ncbi:MAG TPA: SRPBCC domain-containing protein [Solirubrobacterales bacterium]|nr:SRPBCC domain-containing protein [Solirubrobacterales bacterium]
MAIHQEAIIDAMPMEVYAVLTDGERFAAATGLAAHIGDREGDPFSLFGGRVEGRQIELVPGERVVQAWRFGAEHPRPWEAGVYSVVRFTLTQEGAGTRLEIDHCGIPTEAEEQHIESGYPAFYQEPLAKFFAAS